MLSLNNVEVIYDGVILVLKGVSITCPEGRITTLLGANGAGKTTTLKAISGLLRSERGEITKGSVELSGQRIDHMPPHRIVQRGIVQVFEGRRVFEHLTIGVRNVNVRRPSLDDVFIQYTGRDMRDAEAAGVDQFKANPMVRGFRRG